MNKNVRHIDVSQVTDLVRLAEEVRETNEPCVLQRDGEDLAILMPLKPATKHGRRRGKTAAGYQAFLSAFGGWKGLADADALKAEIDMSLYLVDTDWVIDYFNGQPFAAQTLFDLTPQGLAISLTSYGELYEGAFYSADPQSAL